MGDISEHFSKWEVECHCGCGHAIIVPEMIYRLELVRSFTKVRMEINSWCRCIKHNKDVGGIDGSEHISGEGVDIAYDDPLLLLMYLFSFPLYGFRRVIVYPGRLHVGIQANKYQPYFDTRGEVDEWLKTNS